MLFLCCGSGLGCCVGLLLWFGCVLLCGLVVCCLGCSLGFDVGGGATVCVLLLALRVLLCWFGCFCLGPICVCMLGWVALCAACAYCVCFVFAVGVVVFRGCCLDCVWGCLCDWILARLIH